MAAEDKDQWLHFIMRLQQFTGPLMAKGVEDTVFYAYNRLLSLNEVGAGPLQFGIDLDEFHAFNQQRVASWPHAMNASATHDTKRGEDVRARLNVLSEMPESGNGSCWNGTRSTSRAKVQIGARMAPRTMTNTCSTNFAGRLSLRSGGLSRVHRAGQDYLIKATREARFTLTGWSPTVHTRKPC